MTSVITRVRMRGVRSLAHLDLPLNRGLNVLIGENGAGKSTLLEGLELLRRIASGNFWNDFQQIHGGPTRLRRFGSTAIELGVDVTDDEGLVVRYDIVLGEDEILRESCKNIRPAESTDGPDAPETIETRYFVRNGKKVTFISAKDGFAKDASFDTDTTMPALFSLGVREENSVVTMVKEAVRGIRVHVPFEVAPRWVAQAHARKSDARTPQPLFKAQELERLASNIAAAFHSLKNEQSPSEWHVTMDFVRLGLGDWVEDVVTRADDAGQVSLWLKVQGRDDRIGPHGISDGQLAYLAFVALTRLNPGRSLLAFDEPELHLHPKMMSRVLGLFDKVAEKTPVLLATHSRRLLDALDKPADQAILFELDQSTLTTRILRPDTESLSAWLDEYDGLGKLLDAGLAHAVMTDVR